MRRERDRDRSGVGHRDLGLQHTVMEVSSHGLDQGRVNAVAFDMALFTNLGRDHFDYHGSLESYARAKRRLFELPELEVAILNATPICPASGHLYFVRGVQSKTALEIPGSPNTTK